MSASTAPSSPVSAPVYLRAKGIIQEMIEAPDYAPGDRIPSERALSEQLGISRMTIRKALDELVRMGLLERDGTSGTRIAAPRVARPLDDRSRSISQIVQSLGARPGSRLVHFERGAAGPKLAQRLRIARDAPLLVIRRLRSANGTPFCVETSHLPAGRVPGLAAEDLAGDRSLYTLLEQRYGIEASRAEGLIGMSRATRLEAELLALDEDAPVLIYRAVVLDGDGVPIEYLTSVNHPKLVVFKTSHGGVSPEV